MKSPFRTGLCCSDSPGKKYFLYSLLAVFFLSGKLLISKEIYGFRAVELSDYRSCEMVKVKVDKIQKPGHHVYWKGSQKLFITLGLKMKNYGFVSLGNQTLGRGQPWLSFVAGH